MTQLLLVLLLAQAPAPAPAQPTVAGRWQAMAGPGMQWILELEVVGNKVTGTVSQTGEKAESAPIYFGGIEGNALTFKVNSPDGDRVITFVGKITTVELGIERRIEIRPGGSRGDTGILGGNGLMNLTMRRPAAADAGGTGGAGGARGARGARGAGARGQQ